MDEFPKEMMASEIDEEGWVRWKPPNCHLCEISENLSYDIAKELVAQKLFPFALEGNDSGPYVFDAREHTIGNEYPIRVYRLDYGGDLEGLTEIIFSSFSKMLDCLTYYLKEIRIRHNFEIIPDFLQIDRDGAGKTGIDYWIGWAAMQRKNFEMFGE